ncbi:DNA polymerase IV [compost metagenome]
MWHFPVKDSWDIGRRMDRNLARLGINTIGDLANANLQKMKIRFGVIGEQMVLHARGIDLTDPYHKPTITEHAIMQKVFASGITLLRNYIGEDIITVILEKLRK